MEEDVKREQNKKENKKKKKQKNESDVNAEYIKMEFDPRTFSALNQVSGSSFGISGGILSSSPFKIDPTTIAPIKSVPVFGYVTSPLSPSSIYINRTPRETELENKILDLQKQIEQQRSDIMKSKAAAENKQSQITELNSKIEELNKEKRFQYLIYRVNQLARNKLLESNGLRKQFEEQETCDAVIMSVDIRRSTELMLKARTPQLYAEFIRSLCVNLTGIILENYGVFDKFTGDGILAFFPKFYSGEDAIYWAIRASQLCHECFERHYQQNRRCFVSVILDVGLGIGIDWGSTHLVKIQDGLTVIGTPVVYACRMSQAKAGQTLLNQPAYELIQERFGAYVNCQESDIDVKYEGKTLAYLTSLSKRRYEPKLPEWL